MKKTTGLFVLPALLVLLTPGLAHAQYYRYSSGKPSVEVNMDILDSINPDIKWDHDGSRVPAPSPIPLPVTEAPLDAPAETTLPNTDTATDTAPVSTPVVPTRILKPSASAAASALATTSAQAPAKTYAPSPIVQNMMKAPAIPTPLPAPVVKAPMAEPVASAPVVPVVKVPASVTAKTPDTPKKPVTEPVKAENTALDISEAPAQKPVAAPVEATHVTEAAVPAAAVPSLADLSLPFDASANEITEQHKRQLQAVIAHLNQSPDTRLQIRAYATGEDGSKSSARRISLSRALSIRSYLMDMQIKPTRVDVRALGTETDRTPVDRADLVFVR